MCAGGGGGGVSPCGSTVDSGYTPAGTMATAVPQARADDLQLTPDTVAERVHADATRAPTLRALEALPPPIPRELALAAAPALVDVAVGTEDRVEFDRSCLLLARLFAESAPEMSVVGAAFGGGRYAKYRKQPRLLAQVAQRALGGDSGQAGQQPLTRDDAYSMACFWAEGPPSGARGLTAVADAAGLTLTELMHVNYSGPLFMAAKTEQVSQHLLALAVELLRSSELPELVVGGMWLTLGFYCLEGRPRLAPVAVQLGLFDLAIEHLRTIGSPADVVSISRGKACRALAVLHTMNLVSYGSGQKARPDLETCVSCGLFDFCVELVVAFASAGVEGLQDTAHPVVFFAICLVHKCRSQVGCEAKIRGVAPSLLFCLEHSLDQMKDIGMTTGSYAARLCCAVFGRDEGGSEFTFTPEHIKLLTDSWSQVVRAVGHRARQKPSPDGIFAAQLCVSDAHKPLLIANKDFIPYLVDALLLDPEHPRAGMKEQSKAWCQTHHTEALAQLAVYDDSREALLRDGSVVPALEEVMKGGLSEQARELAAAALAALSEKELVNTTDGVQRHVMLSCEFARRV